MPNWSAINRYDPRELMVAVAYYSGSDTFKFSTIDMSQALAARWGPFLGVAAIFIKSHPTHASDDCGCIYAKRQPSEEVAYSRRYQVVLAA